MSDLTIAEPAKSPANRFLSLFINPKRLSHLAGLDTIRGIAVLFVVIYHCWVLSTAVPLPIHIPLINSTIHLDYFISGMGLGVDIFFVLSGFLLSLPWHRAYYAKKPSPKFGTYFQRRFLRIAPPYWFMLTILLLLLTNSTINWLSVFSPDGLKSLVATYLFAHQLLPVTSSAFGINGAIWTLTIEMIFYLILPWFVLLFLGRRWLISLPIALVISVTYLYLARYSLQPLFDFYNSTVAIYHLPASSIRFFMARQFLSTLPEFGLGMALANFWAYRDMHPTARWFRFLEHPVTSIVATVMGLVLLGFAISHVYLEDTHDAYYLSVTFLSATAAGLLILGALNTPNVLHAFFHFLPLRFVGIIGYSVFLWHFPLIILVRQYPIFANSTPMGKYLGVTEIVLPMVLGLSTVLFLLVEKPFIENRKKLEPAVQPVQQQMLPVLDSDKTVPRIAVVRSGVLEE